MNDEHDGLQKIIDEALGSMAAEAVGGFDPQRCNLAEFCCRTGLFRQRARTIKANGFRTKPHGSLGLKTESAVLSGYTGFVDEQLRKGVTSSQAVFERLVGLGYREGLTGDRCLVQSWHVHAWWHRRNAPGLVVEEARSVIIGLKCCLALGICSSTV
ncbi:MAG: hypothetical protein IJ092_09595 [Atopobiaceae bacterium]|nr:hypothetical protein [Atopobiaceae bacterium]